MALIVKTLPGVYGGVSNQSESLRKDNQVTEMINCVPSLVLGTTRRPSVESATVIDNPSTSWIYDYTRDNGESHVLSCTTDGALSAYTVDVEAVNVTMEQGVSDYLTHTDPKDLSGITIGDTTFIVNSTKTVGINNVDVAEMPELDEMYRSIPGDVEIHKENIAYYWLSRSSNDPDHQYRYVVELDGVQYSADSDKSEYATRILANKIKFQEQVCNIVSTKADAQDDFFDVEIRTGSVVGEGDFIDIDGFTWTSIDGFVHEANGDGALTWHRNDVGKYTVTVNTANSQDPISYLLNIGEQEFLVVTETSTNAVADNFTSQLNGFVASLVTPTRNPNGFNTEYNGSILKIWKDDFSDFTFNFWDSWGSLASFGWKYNVPKLQDLPSSFPWDGTVVRINSNDGYTATDYYVIRWKGTWQEFTTRAVYEDGVRKLPLLNNMPIVVRRESDTEFSAKFLKTSDGLRPPLVGNAENVEDPYFVGKQIKQLFYINGRLCVVAGDSLTFSEVDLLWNFYATSVINILDSDSLEVNIASERVLEILQVAIFQSGLLIMTSEGQYLFNTENGISPSTVVINKLSNYSYSNRGGTIYDGDSIVFSGVTGDTARLYRYRVARLTSENKAIDLTIQVPSYIQGTVEQIVNYTEDGTLIVRVDNAKHLYLYREVISGDQMVQSSWYKWDFSNIITTPILHIMVINGYLYFISGDGSFKIPLGLKDTCSSCKDLGTVDFESRIVLTKWRPKKTSAQVQTPRGRLQLRDITVAIDGSAILEVYKEDRDFKQLKPILYDKRINVLSNTDKTVLSILNDADKPFTINGIAMSGTYRDKGRETI